MTDTIAGLLIGAIDMHYHSAPSPFPRKLDVTEAAQQYDAAGFRAVVMKSHHHSTVMEILALQPHMLSKLDVEVYGGIALNGAVGGLNPMAVDLALKMGGRVVWFPTMSSRAHLDYHKVHHDSPFPSSSVRLLPERETTVLDDKGQLKPEVHEILSLIKESDAVLSFGHMGPEEIEAVLTEATRVGVQRLLLNHPDFVLGVSEEQVKDYVSRGVYVEHSIGMYNDRSPRKLVFPIEQLLRWIKVVGVDRTTLGSDVGQLANPTGVETYQRVIQMMLESKVAADDILRMVGANAAELLGLK